MTRDEHVAQTDFMMKVRVQRATVNTLIDQHETFKIFRLTETHQHQHWRVTKSPVNDTARHYNINQR